MRGIIEIIGCAICALVVFTIAICETLLMM